MKYIEDVKLLIIAISEMCLDPDFPTSHVQIDDYNLVRNDRGLKNKTKTRYMQAGGVAYYIHRSLISQVLCMSEISSITETEFIVVEELRYLNFARSRPNRSYSQLCHGAAAPRGVSAEQRRRYADYFGSSSIFVSFSLSLV